MASVTYSIIIPVYKNRDSLPRLIANLQALRVELGEQLEVVFVVDASPDDSYAYLHGVLPSLELRSQLLLLSRNFGSFQAIFAGMEVARGKFLCVIAADLQEPPELPALFFKELQRGSCDVVLGQRISRDDPGMSSLMSGLFWTLYKRFVQKELPKGGVDVFGCTSQVAQVLMSMKETNSSLVGLLLWIGFRRQVVPYARLERIYGKSAWSFRRKYRYLKDSLFAFSDLPITVMGFLGVLGITAATVMVVVIITARLSGAITLPGYTPVMAAILFFGGLHTLGLSLLGEYLWRTFENSKHRPRFIVASVKRFDSLEN